MAYSFTTPCAEMNGSPVEVAGKDSFKATVTLRCTWANRYSLAGEIAGWSLYPNLSATGARARSISITPFTVVNNETPAQNASYENALVVVEYVFDKDTPDEDGGTLFSESLEPTAQNLTQPWESFKWKSGPQIQAGEAPSKILRGLDYVLTKYNLSAIPAAALTLVGCCNDATVSASTLGLSFDAETLLFNPPSLQRTVTIGSSPSKKWTAAYRFTYKPEGWNKFWNARKSGGPGWDTLQVKTPAGGYVDYDQYPPASFSGL